MKQKSFFDHCHRILTQYKHIVLLLYFPVYMSVFTWLQVNTPESIHIVDCPVDRFIPFCEWFVIPYLLWFLYLGVAAAYFFFFEKDMFCRAMYFGMIGMTLFLVIGILYPNGLNLRPESFTRDNICIDLVKRIYALDPPRNVLPSIHVFNSVAACCCILESKKLSEKPLIRDGSIVLTVFIVLSTMFLKQHSVFDVALALLLASISYGIVFGDSIARSMSKTKQGYRALQDHKNYKKKRRVGYRHYYR